MSLTKEDVRLVTEMMSEMMSKMMDEKLAGLEGRLDRRMDEQFSGLEERLDKRMDEQFSGLEERLDRRMDEQFAGLEERLDGRMDEKLADGFSRFENRFLLKVSDMIDIKLKAEMEPIKRRLNRIEVDLLENNVIPRISHIEACYTSTFRRYTEYVDRMDALMMDMEIVKKVIQDDHSKCSKLCSESALS